MRPNRIPLFPLDVVLLPRMPLPLHIFEPRYKLMIGRCLEEHLEFGVILAAGKSLATVGCMAEILEKIKEYPDGRMDILTEGRAVFRLVELLEEKEYYEAVAEYPAEKTGVPDPETQARLEKEFQQCHALLHGEAWVASGRNEDELLAYRMAARLPLALEEKQALLEMREESERRNFLLRWISEFFPKIAHRQRVRQRAGGNGQGLK
jgi:Lon protease-like protein